MYKILLYIFYIIVYVDFIYNSIEQNWSDCKQSFFILIIIIILQYNESNRNKKVL